MEASKENKLECLSLIQDFRSLDYYATLEPSDLKIMAAALVKSCHDLAHARRVVDTWIEGNPQRPTPADLHRLARETSADPAFTLPSPCDLCRDSEIPGYVRGEFTAKRGPFAGQTYSALALCTCERGKTLGNAALKIKRENPGPWRPPEQDEDFTPIGELLP